MLEQVCRWNTGVAAGLVGKAYGRRRKREIRSGLTVCLGKRQDGRLDEAAAGSWVTLTG